MKNFKKIVLKFPNPPKYKRIFKILDRCEILQIYRFNEEDAIYTQKFVFKSKESHPKDLEKFCDIFIEILSENKAKNEYICLVKCYWDEELQNLFNNSNLVIDPPLIHDENFMIVSYILAAKDTDPLIERYKQKYGSQLTILSVSSVQPDLNNLSMLLTEKQKSIMYYAVEKGYYEIPRKIKCGVLAKHFNISESALYEHLRKIEKTVFHVLCH